MDTSSDASLSLREARALYFERSGLPEDGGYGQRWIKLTRKRLPLYLLNSAPRRRAVPYHDLHHVLTGYDTSTTGESEISAWEIAAGTWPHWFALLLDLAGLALGLFIAPRRTLRAFVRGRRSRSLYAEPLTDELLASSVGSTRARLGIPPPGGRATFADRCLFLGVSLAAVLALVLLVALAPLLFLIGWFWQ